jgi:hypothetical protein
MSGDHSVDGFQLWNIVNTQWKYGSAAIDLQEPLNERFFTNLRLHFDAINAGGRAANPFDLAYIFLAFEDASHFHAIDQTLRRELEDIDPALITMMFTDMAFDVATRRADVVQRLFASNVVAKYTVIHTLAMQMASTAGLVMRNDPGSQLDPSGENRRAAGSLLRLAFFMQAFADHYLQDMFAAGHLVTHRQSTYLPYGLQQKAIHDHYNNIGLDVEIPATHARLHIYGDDQMREDAIDVASSAVAASIGETWRSFSVAAATGTPFDAGAWLIGHIRDRDEPASYLAALALVPQPPVGAERDSVVTYRYPRSGPFCGIGLGAVMQNTAWSGKAEGFYGVVFGNETMALGFEINGGYATGPNAATIMGGIDCWLWDAVFVQGAAGTLLLHGGHGTGRVSVGYDLHPTSMMFGFRLAAGWQMTTSMMPQASLQFSVIKY